MTRIISLLVAVAVFIVVPIAVQRFTGYGEQPVLHGVAWLLASLVLYPAASATYQAHNSRPLRFRYYYAVMFGIAVFSMSFEGLLTR
jgi:uncharacterized membrane protein YoaK (UPF0700 family)